MNLKKKNKLFWTFVVNFWRQIPFPLLLFLCYCIFILEDQDVSANYSAERKQVKAPGSAVYMPQC